MAAVRSRRIDPERPFVAGPMKGGLRQKAVEGATGTHAEATVLNQLRTGQFDPCCSSSYGKRGDCLTRQQIY